MKFVLTAALLVLTAKPSFSQTPQFRSEGVLLKTQKGTNLNETIVFTAGGFVNITYTDTTGRTQWYGFSRERSKVTPLTSNAEIYLKVREEYVINRLQIGEEESLHTYIIKRVYALPEVLLLKDSDPAHPVSVKGTIILAAGEKVRFKSTESPESANKQIQFTFINRKTNKQEFYESDSEFQPRKIESGVTYELRYNYAVQPETIGVIHIEVEPDWFQRIPDYVFFLASFIIIIIVITFLLYRQKLARARQTQQELEQASLRLQSQLNPHFTFNALSTIQGLMNTGRIPEANDYLQNFSDLLRKTLSKSKQIFNSLDQEISMMRTYIKLEALRFNFAWSIDVDDDLDLPSIEIPTLLLQPVIENAIRHGLSGLGEKGTLEVSVRKNSLNSFDIFIRDNGNWTSVTPESGYGLSLTKDRIETLNRMQGVGNIGLAFQKANGTIAKFTFTNWLDS